MGLSHSYLLNMYCILGTGLNTISFLFFFRKYKWEAVEGYGISGSRDLECYLLRSYNMLKVLCSKKEQEFCLCNEI